MNFWGRIYLVVLIGVSVAVFQNCSPYKSPGVASTSSLAVDNFSIADYGDADIVTTFSNTLKPFFAANACTSCHGANQNPKFAVTDASAAYSAIKLNSLVDFANPANSKMVKKIRSGHNGFPTYVADDIVKKIGAWKQALKDLETDPDLDPDPDPDPDPTPNPDILPPTVSITAPANNATVSGTVTVTVQALDQSGIEGVRFFLDDGEIGTEDKTSPYSYTWNTATYVNRAYKFKALAKDKAGNEEYSLEIALTVSNTATQPNPDAKYSWLSPNLFIKHCTSCHGAGQASAGYRVHTYNAVLAKINFSNLAQSNLLKSSHPTQGFMPPSAPLSAREYKALEDWILSGAPNN